MAAAALSSSRGAPGVRTTRGLFFFFFTLLCLVCLSSSMTDKEKLAKLKEKFQKAQQKLDMEKAQMATSSELMKFYTGMMDPLMSLMKKNKQGLPKDFPPLEGLMMSLKDFMEKTKTYVDGRAEELSEELEEKEQKLREISRQIDFLEEDQADL